MAILNITYQGHSADLPAELDFQLSDNDVKRIAVELVRSGGVPGLVIASFPEDAFQHYVVDRFQTREGGQRIYLRPKVPFGGIAG